MSSFCKFSKSCSFCGNITLPSLSFLSTEISTYTNIFSSLIQLQKRGNSVFLIYPRDLLWLREAPLAQKICAMERIEAAAVGDRAPRAPIDIQLANQLPFLTRPIHECTFAAIDPARTPAAASNDENQIISNIFLTDKYFVIINVLLTETGGSKNCGRGRNEQLNSDCGSHKACDEFSSFLQIAQIFLFFTIRAIAFNCERLQMSHIGVQMQVFRGVVNNSNSRKDRTCGELQYS